MSNVSLIDGHIDETTEEERKRMTKMKNNIRERLIELIRQSHCVDVWDYWNDELKQPNPIETLADHLIKNDVVPVVRCKDCKHRYAPTRCALWYGTVNDQEYFVERGEDFYCSYGERK